MSTPLRAAIVGLTGIGGGRTPAGDGALRRPKPVSHAGAYVAEARTELVAVCDRRDEAIADFRAQWPELDGVASYQDFADLLATERPEIVSIATSDHLHADLTVAAVRAGAKAILCEKPIATTLADADRMIGACADAGVLLSIEYTRRWAPLFVEAKRILASGALGAVHTLGVELYGPRAMLFRNGSHLIDLLCWYAGTNPEWVVAELQSGFDHYDTYRGDGGRDPASDPSAVAMVHFGGDVRATYVSVKTKTFSSAVTVTGDEGKLMLSDSHGRLIRGGELRSGQKIETIEPPEYLAVRQHAAVVELVDALEAGASHGAAVPLTCGGDEARKTLEIMLAMLRSHARGNVRVDLPLPPEE